MNMSDDEHDFGSSAPVDDEELSLPKATIQKLIQEYLPKDMSCAKDTRDLLIECCVEFIHLVSSESNEACEKDSKKTIAPDHVVKALVDLGFEKYTREVQDVLNDHRQHQKERERKASRFELSGLTEEELQRQQEELFAASKARFDAAN
ncbi:negative cofactor 2 transcription regulator complex subunit ncb2 [Malassezia nana]|uniref:Negative cofactor 2 transcription regulator complex subunit ncb2 n=1 Tax=Malassezia nana TaxID=180528 RepID=A0AAF0J3C7_9BASI|nr:negative cofactor 2 transcription regulator complex subunit ncb2 [Malassezia nana]